NILFLLSRGKRQRLARTLTGRGTEDKRRRCAQTSPALEKAVLSPSHHKRRLHQDKTLTTDRLEEVGYQHQRHAQSAKSSCPSPGSTSISMISGAGIRYRAFRSCFHASSALLAGARVKPGP